MNANENDDDIVRRLDEIDIELIQSTNDANRGALEKERESLKDKIKARNEFDNNEANNMSSTDDTVRAGRPNSHPLNKLKDRIRGNKKTEQQDEQPEQEPDHEQNQSKPEPDKEQQQEQQSEPEEQQQQQQSSGIRTIPVVEVNVIPGPYSTPSQPSTNQQQPDAMRSLGRQHYDSRYVNTPNVWQYPNSRHNTDQVGLVQQSYKSYFGLN